MIRPPVAVGFYPGDAGKLRAMVEELLDAAPKLKTYRYGVSPHAGYVYSGFAAAHLFKNLEKADTVVVLGVDHFGAAPDIGIYPYEAWETPLGTIAEDSELKRALLELKPVGIPASYDREHSIEVMLPFLQILGFEKFLPVLVPRLGISRLRELGEKLKELDVPIIASSDMSHYVPEEVAKAKDRLAIEKILAKDAPGLIQVVLQENISMCGVFPVSALLFALPKEAKGELLAYYTSGKVTGDYGSVVGYAAIGFYV